jgi:hypothetical protein
MQKKSLSVIQEKSYHCKDYEEEKEGGGARRRKERRQKKS